MRASRAVTAAAVTANNRRRPCAGRLSAVRDWTPRSPPRPAAGHQLQHPRVVRRDDLRPDRHAHAGEARARARGFPISRPRDFYTDRALAHTHVTIIVRKYKNINTQNRKTVPQKQTYVLNNNNNIDRCACN